ncbi:MAG: hypothetical protein IKT52_10590 [Oscillospiraceae bacterium]|nr:hypothetical protein [Oscillospiraceae bacterium]
MIQITQKQLDIKKINKIYEKLIVPKVEETLRDFVQKENSYRLHPDTWVQDALKITISFLTHYGLYGSTLSSDDLRANIMKYLLDREDNPQEYLEGIIFSFWRYAANVCIDRIIRDNGKHIDYLPDKDIITLSKLEGIKKKVLEQTNQNKRREIFQDVLNDRICCLLSNASKKDVMEWLSGIRSIEDQEINAIELVPMLSNALHRKDETNGALDLLAGIFAYDDILNRNLVAGTPRHQLLSAMNVPVCPYCNRQYITLFCNPQKGGKAQKDTVKETTADLDHFYIKSQYPYLSLSLYNFIPSCQICNSRFKGTTDFYVYPHIYPYKEGFGDNVKFTTKLDEFQAGDNGTIELATYSSNEAVQNSISTFMLEHVYQSHTDYVNDIQRKAEKYNEKMIASLKSQFGDLLGDSRSIMDDLYGQYLDQSKFYLRPLAKLTKDILAESYGSELEWDNI